MLRSVRSVPTYLLKALGYPGWFLEGDSRYQATPNNSCCYCSVLLLVLSDLTFTVVLKLSNVVPPALSRFSFKHRV